MRQEYFPGTVLSNGQLLPCVKTLELLYGPRVRSGSAGTGYSWRGKHVTGSQRKDNDFARRRLFYDILESEGEAGYARLLDEVKMYLELNKLPSESWKSTTWLLEHLRLQRVDADPAAKRKSDGAKAGAAKSTKRHRPAPMIPIAAQANLPEDDA